MKESEIQKDKLPKDPPRRSAFSSRNILYIGIVLCVIVLASMLLNKNMKSESVPEEIVVPTITPPSDQTIMYENKEHGVSFQYPAHFKTTETADAGSLQNSIFFDYGQKRIAFERIASDGTIPQFTQTDQTIEINGITWSVLKTDKDDVNCEAGNCGRVSPSYYFFRDGYQYSFFYYSDDLEPVVEKILQSFRVIDTQSVLPTKNPSPVCADYRRGDERISACATCGNTVCEPYETCTPSGSDGNIGTADCGKLVCPRDCEQN